MATKGCDSTAHHHSSIALLQERFRQLQRAKEMRKEKELLRLFSEPEGRVSKPPSKRNYEPTALFFHSHDSLLPHHASRPVLAPSQYQNSLYLNPNPNPNLQGKQGGFQGAETSGGPMFSNVGSTGSAMMSYDMAYNLDDHNSDVDTSLHL